MLTLALSVQSGSLDAISSKKALCEHLSNAISGEAFSWSEEAGFNTMRTEPLIPKLKYFC